MSGHSHWATIKHKKGATDAKRGRLWSKLSRAIIIAGAQRRRGDPNMNLKLRLPPSTQARQVSMPKDNIERAIKRGTGDVEGIIFEEITYEGIGPGGVAVLVDTLTDNRNRTNGEVRKIFERCGGKMGSRRLGRVSVQGRKGVFSVKGTDEDTLLSIVLDAGAEDVKQAGAHFEIICDAAHFNKVQEALQQNNIAMEMAEITQPAGVAGRCRCGDVSQAEPPDGEAGRSRRRAERLHQPENDRGPRGRGGQGRMIRRVRCADRLLGWPVRTADPTAPFSGR